MRTNLRNQARQTHLPHFKPLLPVFEAIMNSVQAIEDAGPTPSHKIIVTITREPGRLDDKEPAIYSVAVTDTGVGFDDNHFASFNELYSEHRLEQGGKGIGRTLWLKTFDRAEINSTYRDTDGTMLERKFSFDAKYDSEAIPALSTATSTGTTVLLTGFQEPYKSACLWTPEQIGQRIIEHFLLVFLQPTCPQFELWDLGPPIKLNDLFAREFNRSATKHPFKIKGVDFSLHGFRLYTQRNTKHRLIYAAGRRGVVQDNLDDLIPNLSGAKLPADDGSMFYYLAIVQSPYLTQKVNPARTDFNLAHDDAESTETLFPEEVSRSEIRDACIQYVHKDLAGIIQSINDAKSDTIRKYVEAEAPEYKLLMKYLPEFIDEIPPSPTKAQIEAGLHREQHQREVKLRHESSRIIREAERVSNYDEYYARLTEFMTKYNELGISQLATYVGHRKIILEFLERAISKGPKDDKYPLENVVHQLIFPQRSNSDEVPYQEHNLWLIDERLTFHSLVTSDQPLASVSHLRTESEKRPDLFIFDRRVVFSEDEAPLKSIVLVEFKRPQRDDYTMDKNPFTQCLKMVNDIRDSAFLKPEDGRPIPLQGKDIPAYCYIVCDITPTLKAVLKLFSAQRLPDGNGYFAYNSEARAYLEVIDYDKLLNDAKKRNRVFFQKLNILSQK